jgi:TolA-binding protein
MPPAKKNGQTIDMFLVPLAGNQTQSVEDLQHSEEQNTDSSNNVQSEMFVVEDTEDMEEISEEKYEEDLDQMKKTIDKLEELYRDLEDLLNHIPPMPFWGGSHII